MTALAAASSEALLQEIADRMAVRRLVDLYARSADRRDAKGQAALFAEDARLAVYQGDPATSEPVQLLQGRAKLTSALDFLNTFQATMHFIGQHVVDFDADGATGETHCLAYHLFEQNGQRMLMVMSIRNHDVFIRTDGQWLFAERKIIIDWTDSHPSTPQEAA
jgi:hypothetical protein